MKLLAIGTCRLYKPCHQLSGIKQYPYGTVHSAREILQSLRLLTGDVKAPENLLPYMFRRTKDAEIQTPEVMDLDDFDGFIIEISSLKNYICNNTYLHHFWYKAEEKHGKLKKKVKCEKETTYGVLSTMREIRTITDEKPMIIQLHNNIRNVTSRAALNAALIEFCSFHHNVDFIDPTPIIKRHGVERCILKDEDFELANHFTDFMNELMSREIKKKIEVFDGNN